MKPFAYEWARLRTLRSTWILSVLSLLFSVLTGLLSIPVVHDDPTALPWMAVLSLAVPTVTALSCGLIGVFGVGHEYRYGTIRATLTALPRRVPVLLAKIAVPALFSAALSVLCLTITYGLAWTLVHSDLQTSPMSLTVARVMVGAALYAIGFSVIGAGLTALFRNQVAGIVLLLVVPLVIENAITAGLILIPWFDKIEDWSRFLPFGAGRAMYAPPPEVRQFKTNQLAPLGGAAVYFVFGASICALGMWRFHKSDA